MNRPEQSGDRRPGRLPIEPLLVAAALTAWWCLAVGSTLGKSATSDEPLHIIGGVTYWRLNDYRLQPENGNLPQRWCALPLALAGWPLPSFDHPGWAGSDMASLSRAYLFEESGNPPRLMLALARSFAAVWGVLVAVVVALWSRELFGSKGAWLSLAFCLFDTTLLANAPLATSDACAAFFFAWSTWSLWRMLELPSPGRTIMAAVAVAGLFLAKFSAPLEIGVGLILLAVRSRYGAAWEVAWAGRRRRVSAAAGLAAVAAGLVVVVATAWLAVWMAYGFRYEAMNLRAAPDGTLAGFHGLAEATRELGGAKGRLLGFLAAHRLLPEAYLYGMAYVLNMMLRQAFFCGDYWIAGWWRYFPFTFLVKTPLPTLAALALVPLLASRRRPAPAGQPVADEPGTGAWYPLTPVLALLAVYWATSLRSTLNIGHRHLLPVYPAVFVLLGALPGLCHERIRLRRLPWALAACTAAVGLASFPHYLAFFNGIVRRNEAWHYLVDSNVDWGQEHYALEDFVADERRRHGREHPVYGCLFDPTPQGTGVAAVTPLPTAFRPVPLPPLGPGTYCVSATHLQGIYLPLWGPWTAKREERYQDRCRTVALLEPLSAAERQERHGIAPEIYDRIVADRRSLAYHRFLAQLRERPPDAVINGSILVYRLDAPAFESILAADPPAQTLRFPSSPLFD